MKRIDSTDMLIITGCVLGMLGLAAIAYVHRADANGFAIELSQAFEALRRTV